MNNDITGLEIEDIKGLKIGDITGLEIELLTQIKETRRIFGNFIKNSKV